MVSDTPFLRACRQQPVDRIPVWMMRQAGRYQPEYRALKERVGGFWGLCTSPESVAEATLFAQRSLGTDAAIIFSDITVPAWAMGLDLEFAPGPKFSTPVRSAADVDALQPYDPHSKTDFLMRGIEQTRAGLADDVSLIGFVGAPLTVAGYMIEGYPSRNWIELKRMLFDTPELMHRLLDKVTTTLIAHAKAQVEAGCDTIQVFDTTAGELPSAELRAFAFHYAERVIAAVKELGVPVIYFARRIAAHLPEAAALGADVLGVDWSLTLKEARQRIGDDTTLMGNLDPTVLFNSPSVVAARVREILADAEGLPGFIFNLGHGILPETPVENAKLLVETVHGYGG